jgi:hypothetical protein
VKNKKNKKNAKQLTSYFVADITEDGAKVKSIPEPTDMSDGVMIYIIMKEEIENCDVKRLVHDLRPDDDNPIFTSGPGRVIFMVDGFDEDPRELMMIPEFRKFIKKADQARPCWMYFARPESKWLLYMLAVTGEKCTAHECGEFVQFNLDPYDKFAFLTYQINAFLALCRQAGIDSRTCEAHIRESVKHAFQIDLPPGSLN